MKLVYFAWLRERLGIDEETVDLPDTVETVAHLLEWQKSRSESFADVFEHSEIIQVAINQKHERNREASILDANEIALFPPMTGG
ncbi:MAG: molybdopterin converting factor subunit 1 [Pseudomonadota bacterium]